MRRREKDDAPSADADLRLLDDGANVELLDNGTVTRTDESACRPDSPEPPELSSNDIEVLRAGFTREHDERRRAECLAEMQAAVVQLALDLLVREPDIEGFFGGLTRNMVEETE